MPSSYPGISFNHEGICNFCTGYKDREYLGKQELVELMNSADRKSEYDCVVPLSGGKDSTYILYFAVKELKLNCIAVSYDSGFQTDIARENVRKTCAILDVPLVVRRSPGDVQSKLTRECLLLARRMGFFVGFSVCGNCEVILRTISFNVAKTYGVPFILWGSSPQESIDEDTFERYRYGETRKADLASSFTKTSIISMLFLRVLRKMHPNATPYVVSQFAAILEDPERRTLKAIFHVGYHAIRWASYSVIQRMLMGVPVKYALKPIGLLPFSERNPRFVHFFDYIHWDSIRNIRSLEDELHWKHPEGTVSRFDCDLHCLVNYAFLRKYNISQDGVNLCNFVREKKMSREEAMRREREIQNSVNRECEDLIRRVGLDDFALASLSSGT